MKKKEKIKSAKNIFRQGRPFFLSAVLILVILGNFGGFELVGEAKNLVKKNISSPEKDFEKLPHVEVDAKDFFSAQSVTLADGQGSQPKADQPLAGANKSDGKKDSYDFQAGENPEFEIEIPVSNESLAGKPADVPAAALPETEAPVNQTGEENQGNLGNQPVQIYPAEKIEAGGAVLGDEADQVNLEDQKDQEKTGDQTQAEKNTDATQEPSSRVENESGNNLIPENILENVSESFKGILGNDTEKANKADLKDQENQGDPALEPSSRMESDAPMPVSFLRETENSFEKLSEIFEPKENFTSAKNKKLAEAFWNRMNGWVGIKKANAADSKIIKTEVLDASGNVDEKIQTLIEESANPVKIKVLKPERSFRPGKYSLRVEMLSADETKVLTSTQDFTWGVLAINVNKSIYSPEETAKLAFAVLDESGEMVCDAKLSLEIKNPAGETKTLSTDGREIKVNRDVCASHQFTLEPDYEAKYKTGEWGTYEMTLAAETANGTHTIADKFEVSNAIAFDVERTTATRIFPGNKYPVMFDITANQDFSGEIRESVPASFDISKGDEKNYASYDSEDTKDETKILTWDVKLKKGEKATLGYQYDAPDVSPQFYLLGPLQFYKNSGGDSNGVRPASDLVFGEARQWQIAADAAITYVGGQVGSSAGTNGSTTVTFSLTGGSNSTPQAGDLVVLSFSNGDTGNKTLTITNASSVAYTYAGGSDLYQNGTSYDSNFVVGYRFMPATPETSALLAGGDASGGRAWTVHVFRNVDPDNPLDVAAVTAGGISSHLANPGLITPTTSGAWIYVAGAGATGTGANFAAAYLTGFRTAWGVDTQDGDVGAGYVTWSSGDYDPAAFTGGGSGTTTDSWNAVTLALRPYVPPPVTISGTSGMRTGDTVKVAINGTVYGTTGTIDSGTGNWSISVAGTDIASGNSVIVWTDTATIGNQSTAIAKWDGSGDMTGMVLDANVLSVGSANSSGVTSAEADDFTCSSSDGGNVMHAFATSTLSVDGCSHGYSAEKIDILASNTLTIGAETLTTYHLTITGTLTSSGASTYNVAGNWTNNGTAFTASSSTVNMNGGAAQTLNGSTSTTFNNLSLSNASTDVAVGTNAVINGTLTVNASTILTPGAAVVISGGTGTLTGSGTVKVSRASGNDLTNQYTINTKTLTDLTVDYTGSTGSGLTITDTTYGNAGSGGLKISGSMATGTQTATVGGAFTVTGTFTPSAGTITMNNGSSISNSGSLIFQALTIAASATVTANNSFSTNGNFTVNGSATFTPDPAAVMNGTGTLTGTGTVQVTRTISTPDFSTQYTISNKTLSGLTVAYVSNSTQTVSALNYGNLSSSGAGGRTLASTGTIGVSGTFTVGTNSYTATGSTVDYNGAGQTVGAINYNNLTLSDSGTKTLQTGTTSISGNFTLSGTASTTLVADLAVAGQVTVNTGTTLGLGSSGYTLTLSGSGTGTSRPLYINGGNVNEGTNSTVTFTGTSASDIQNETYYNIIFAPTSGSPTYTLLSSTTVTGKMTVGNGSNAVTFATNNQIIDLNGDFEIKANGGSFTAPSSASFTLAGNFLNSGTFTASSGTLNLDGGSNQSVTTGSSSFYNLTVANASASPGVTFVDGTSVSNLFKDVTPASTLTFTASTTSALNDIQLHGAASPNYVTIRSNTTTAAGWNVTKAAPQNDVSFVDVSYNDAHYGSQIDASNGTNNDGLHNTSWNFAPANQNPNLPSSLGPAGVIDSAGWTNGNTPTFNFTLSDNDAGQQVKFEIQISDTSNFSNIVTDYTSALAAQGAASFTVGQAAGSGTYNGGHGSQGQTLSDSAIGSGYYWRVKAIDAAAAESAYQEAGVGGTIDFRVDATAPTSGSVYDGTSGDQDWNDGSLTSISGNWTGFNPDTSGLQKYEYAIRRQPDGYYWSVCSGAGSWQAGENWCDNSTTASFTQNNLNLQTGVIYYVSVKTTDNAGNTENAVNSNGQQVLPTLSFSLGKNAITFNNLNSSNGWTDTQTMTTNTSTNASSGYTVKSYETQLMTSTPYPTKTVADFAGTWSSPLAWSGGTYGFGYTTSDNLVQGSNRFSSGNNYAAFSQTVPGDVVADHTDAVNGSTGSVTNEQFTVTYKVSVSNTQDASEYKTYVVYIATANY